MKKGWKEIWYFFFSQEFADGIRVTMAILLPALISSYFDQLPLGLNLSLGALCTSISDAPGPLRYKRNGMFFCLIAVFGVAMITGFARLNAYVMGGVILLLSFFFSMFNVYGTRAAAVGSAGLLVMILRMDTPVAPSGVLLQALLICGGGLWYLIVSMVFHTARPYRTAQRALGDCIREVASFLSMKAAFYNTATDLEEDYRKLVSQQVVVHEKQEAVRELLFKNRLIVAEATPQAEKLVLTFIEGIDLFEEITATYYDYTSLRQRFEQTGVLDSIALFVSSLAYELDAIGIAIQTNTHYRRERDVETGLVNLKKEIDTVSDEDKENSSLILKKILVNLRKVVKRFEEIEAYFNPERKGKKGRVKLEHSRFVEHFVIDPKVFWNNLTLHSSVFRHSVRVAAACIVAYTVVKTFSYGEHSYWILMTVAFILKPAYSLTRQRNRERITGTVTGGIIGVVILLLVQNTTVLFFLLVLFMIITYSFQRTRYVVMVTSVTPFMLILFTFLGVGFKDVVAERLIDTIAGGILAFGASHFLFPSWEKEQLRTHLLNMLKANIAYLHKLGEAVSGVAISTLDYKLARRKVYVESANLGAAFQRMLSEPKTKQQNTKEVYQFVVLNHILFSNVATLLPVIIAKPQQTTPELSAIAANTVNTLSGIVEKWDGEYKAPETKTYKKDLQLTPPMSPQDEEQIGEQLRFINSVSGDIRKQAEAIMHAE